MGAGHQRPRAPHEAGAAVGPPVAAGSEGARRFGRERGLAERQRIRVEHVVRVEEGHERAPRRPQAGVARGREPAVRLLDEPHAGVRGHRARDVVRRSVVHHHDLGGPQRLRLRAHDGVADELGVPVAGNHDGDVQRAVGGQGHGRKLAADRRGASPAARCYVRDVTR